MNSAGLSRSRSVLNTIVCRPVRLALWLICLTVIATVQSCTWFFAPIGDDVAEAVFPDLATPPEMEAPPTFKQYPSSSITQAILGGRGRGLNCSIPWIGKSLFETPAGTASVSLHFRPSCVMHDLCYRHGYATYGYSQADCDRALQASAFRMCRQINAIRDGKEEVFESCQTEAKKVLLGVSIGGAGSFQASGKSTYFEYDPMPENADNYVIGRAYPLDQAQASAGEFGVVTYHFWRNTVRARLLKVDPADPRRLLEAKSEFVPYPEQYLPTAPTLEWLGDGQSSLIALARMTFGDTRLAQVQFSSQSDGAKVLLALTPCPSPLNKIQCSQDMDTSINKLANVEGRPMLVSLRHRASLKQNNASAHRIPTVKLVRLDLAEERKIEDYALNGTSDINDGYRFLQNDMLLEKNSEGHDTHAWILVRGMQIDSQSRLITPNPDAQGYKDRLMVIRQPLADGQAGNTQRFMLDAKETDDPLSLVRLQQGAGVALVGLSWVSSDLKNVEAARETEHSPVLSMWRLPDLASMSEKELSKPEPISLSPALMHNFIERPPLVVDAPGSAAPVFVWTRMAADAKSPETQVSFDIVLTALNSSPDRQHASALTELGSLACKLDLKQQIHSVDAFMIRQFVNRSLGKKAVSELNAGTEISSMKELLKRWKMSQTIVSRKPSTELGVDNIAVTAVFNGYPGMSFQVILKNVDGRLRYSQHLPRAPYLECGDI